MSMHIRKNVFKKCIPVLLSIILIFSSIGDMSSSDVRAEDYIPEIVFHYDDRGTGNSFAYIKGESISGETGLPMKNEGTLSIENLSQDETPPVDSRKKLYCTVLYS